MLGKKHTLLMALAVSGLLSMLAFVLFGDNGLTDYLRLKAERDRPMTIVATGGLAPLFQQSADLFDVMEDDLTMHGLTVIHKFNKDNA